MGYSERFFVAWATQWICQVASLGAICLLFLGFSGCAMTVAQDREAASPERVVESRGMQFRYRIDDGQLIGELSAPTDGWLLVGFNDRRGLDGARLLMFRVVDGEGEGETHLASPPNHFPRREMLGWDPLVVVHAEVSGGTTIVRFRTSIRGSEGIEPSLDATRELILAYSEHKDFYHHSAMRMHISREL
ncbi:MAG: hypothetical protein AAGF12_29310 [Myxococcota bacterium]